MEINKLPIWLQKRIAKGVKKIILVRTMETDKSEKDNKTDEMAS